MYIFALMIVLIFLFDDLVAIINTRKNINHAGILVDTFSHKKTLFLVQSWVLIAAFYLSFVLIKYVNFNDIFFLITAYIILLIRLFNKSRSIKVYEKGILINGQYLEWYMIKEVEVEKRESIIISSDYFAKDYIKCSHIKSVEELKQRIEINIKPKELVITSPNTPVSHMPVFDWIAGWLLRIRG